MTMVHDEKQARKERDAVLADPGPRSFLHTLALLADGDAQTELTAEWHRLVEEVAEQARSTGKSKGEITLKVKLAMDGKGIADVAYDVAAKRPKPSRSKSTLWLDKHNRLVNENPRQGKLPLRRVDEPETEARDVAETGKAMR